MSNTMTIDKTNDPNRTIISPEALAQAAQPLMERLGRLGQGAFLALTGVVLPGEGVGFVAPVQTDPRHRRQGRWRRRGERGGRQVQDGVGVHIRLQ